MRRFDVAMRGQRAGRDVAVPPFPAVVAVPPAIGSSRRQKLDAMRRSASLVGGYAAVILAAAPFGSIDPGWNAIWAGLLAFSLLLADLPRITRRDVVILSLALAAASSFFGVAALQKWGPPSWSASTWSDPIWRETETLLKRALGERPAATAANPFDVAGTALIMLLAFLRFALMGRSDADQLRIAFVLALGSLALSLVGFVIYVLQPMLLLGEARIYYRGSFTATFVNRNTAATYLGSCALLWFALLLRSMRALRPSYEVRWYRRLFTALDQLKGREIGAAFAMLVALGLLAMTNSRAGLIFTLSCLLLAAAIRGRRGRSRNVALVLALLTFFVTLAVAGGGVLWRIGANGITDPYRIEVYRITFDMIAARPWLGTGLGSFDAIFPSVRSEALGMFGVWDQAHSSPLELAVEMGLPVALAVLIVWIAVMRRLWIRAWRSRGGSLQTGFACVAMLGTLHSCVDFSLQVPGYAVFFAAVCGSGASFGRGAARPQAQPNAKPGA